MTTIATYHVRMVYDRAAASGKKSSVALSSWRATTSKLERLRLLKMAACHPS